MPTFVLFDIDGTLIDAGRAGSRSLNLALEDLRGIREGFRGINFAGKTDLQIIREGLEKLGLQGQDGIEGALMDRYLVHLRVEMARGERHLKDGVKDLLNHLRATEGMYLGLLTGNLEQGARLKLGPFGLNPFFPVGAFGSDDEDRNLLLPVAVRRFREREGFPIGYEDCVVVGDTPRDVACARRYGSPCIAVATGPYSREALGQTGADLVIQDLADTGGILRWIVDTRVERSRS
jgi:phosphoglycolate phosphatase-like HAD superfamily hydrolase